MRNLLSQFSPESFTVITRAMRGFETVQLDPRLDVRELAGAALWLPGRFYKALGVVRFPVMMARAKSLARRLKPTVIVGVFPDKEALAMTIDAAEASQTPWIAYLHDTVSENYAGTQHAAWADTLQRRTFEEAASVFVTGQGMRELYLRDYGFTSKALEISYVEPIPTELPDDHTDRQAFLGGTIYGVNRHSVCRAAQAFREADCRLVLATSQSWKALETYGLTEELADREFFRERPEYLSALKRQGILAVTLDWPDESEFSPTELATAFPTRAVEYLASGRPVLVHCPEHYFLARFFNQHQCGLVVSDRSVDALGEAARSLLAGGEEVSRMRQAALRVARDVFSIDRLARVFRDEVNAVAKLKWSQRLG